MQRKTYGNKIRTMICLDPQAYSVVSKLSKFRNHSMSKIISALIIQKLADPKQILINEKKELARKMYTIDKQLEDLEADTNDKKNQAL